MCKRLHLLLSLDIPFSIMMLSKKVNNQSKSNGILAMFNPVEAENCSMLLNANVFYFYDFPL